MTNIYSGHLRHRLTIQRRNTKIGTRGQSLEEWEEIGRCWASIKPMYGRELEAARRRQENVSVKIVTRKQSAKDMDPTYRLEYKGDYYYVGFVNVGGEDLRDITVFCGSTRS